MSLLMTLTLLLMLKLPMGMGIMRLPQRIAREQTSQIVVLVRFVGRIFHALSISETVETGTIVVATVAATIVMVVSVVTTTFVVAVLAVILLLTTRGTHPYHGGGRGVGWGLILYDDIYACLRTRFCSMVDLCMDLSSSIDGDERTARAAPRK